jgi:pimeloyl-ACP methyl ester carboxylesterase
MERREIATPAGPMAALVWEGAGPAAPWLHFAHATGMNAALYARLLAPLAADFRIIASDARGHGRTRLPADAEALGGWEDFACDLLDLLDVVAPGQPWLLAGHSMGGTASLLAAARAPNRVRGLLLLDPPFIPFAEARQFEAAGGRPENPMADQAGRRRPGFPSREAARAAYRGRGVFSTWADEDLDAYLEDGLVDSAEGALLACTPAWEAATFRAVSLRVEPALQALTVPFALLAAEHGSTVREAELAHFAEHPMCLDAQRLPGTTHFLPLEAGDAVRTAVRLVAAAAEPLSGL